MAKAKVTHSTDGVCVTFKGNPKSPEPSLGVIKFPGGNVEVSRTTDGKYWAHISIDNASFVENSRIDHNYEGYNALTREQYLNRQIPQGDKVNHVAVLVNGPFVDNSTL